VTLVDCTSAQCDAVTAEVIFLRIVGQSKVLEAFCCAIRRIVCVEDAQFTKKVALMATSASEW